jgi:hypothetical protein
MELFDQTESVKLFLRRPLVPLLLVTHALVFLLLFKPGGVEVVRRG